MMLAVSPLLLYTVMMHGSVVTSYHPLHSPPKKDFTLFSSVTAREDSSAITVHTQSSSVENDFDFVRQFTLVAIHERGTPKGLEALRILSEKSRQRLPYQYFEKEDPHRRRGSVVQSFRKLLPSNATDALVKEIRELESRGYISNNPDSVDGLPSLHLNIVSHGKPTAPNFSGQRQDGDFQHISLQRLLSLVRDPIYNALLPRVRELLQDSSIQVSDIFVRRYGQDVCQNQYSRRGISAHYDVFSRVTCVIALDDTAADGRNGLFTTLLSRNGSTSNHAAMRRFFPLDCGDGVVHTWDILHGVDVEPHLDRTSLIIWFTQEDDNGDQTRVSPWLLERDTKESKRDNVADFVLASALSSIGESGLDQAVLEHEIQSCPSDRELYLESAVQGNTFALTRVGCLIEEDPNDRGFVERAWSAIQRLSDESNLPAPLQEASGEVMGLAMRFWYEGAMRGNPLAQRALADELMMRASNSSNNDQDTRTLAAVLFALAAQQGDEDATNALLRVLDVDLVARRVQNDNSFLTSPVVQITRAALAST